MTLFAVHQPILPTRKSYLRPKTVEHKWICAMNVTGYVLKKRAI